MNPNNIVQSEEDKKKFEEKFGVHIDNVGVTAKVEGFDWGVTMAIWQKGEKFVARVGHDIDSHIAAEADSYSGCIKAMMEKL